MEPQPGSPGSQVALRRDTQGAEARQRGAQMASLRPLGGVRGAMLGPHLFMGGDRESWSRSSHRVQRPAGAGWAEEGGGQPEICLGCTIRLC